MEIEPILIEYKKNEDGFSGWHVTQGERNADSLGYDEMLGLVASLTMPKERPCLQWMKTKEQKQAWKNRMNEISKRNKNG